jgi:hypothetical protein
LHRGHLLYVEKVMRVLGKDVESEIFEALKHVIVGGLEKTL